MRSFTLWMRIQGLGAFPVDVRAGGTLTRWRRDGHVSGYWGRRGAGVAHIAALAGAGPNRWSLAGRTCQLHYNDYASRDVTLRASMRGATSACVSLNTIMGVTGLRAAVDFLLECGCR